MRPVSGFFNNVMDIIWNLSELSFHEKESSWNCLSIALYSNMGETDQGITPWTVRDHLK